MAVTFVNSKVGNTYSRNDLAILWGYKSFLAIARGIGIVTPHGDNKFVEFITEEKQSSSCQYVDSLRGNALETEGPDDHFAEEPIAEEDCTAEEIHLFYRERHRTDFTHKGQMRLLKLQPRSDGPTHFKYEVL